MKVPYFLIKRLEDMVEEVTRNQLEDKWGEFWDENDGSNSLAYKKNCDKVVEQLKMMVFGE